MKKILFTIGDYFKENYLIYVGVILCHISCFVFPFLFYDNSNSDSIAHTLLVIFSFLFFIIPIILCVIYVRKSFSGKTKKHRINNIIHAYIGSILVFTALYFQSMVMGDINDTINKYHRYTWQIHFKPAHENMAFHKVNDRRAFNGINAKLWTGIDNPDRTLQGLSTNDANYFYNFKSGDYNIPLEYIEELVTELLKKDHSLQHKYVPYIFQWDKVPYVYLDCFCYSVGCISLTGFSGISADIWYTKLFTVTEILAGIAIFIFAIGVMFSKQDELSNNKKIIHINRYLNRSYRHRRNL